MLLFHILDIGTYCTCVYEILTHDVFFRKEVLFRLQDIAAVAILRCGVGSLLRLGRAGGRGESLQT